MAFHLPCYESRNGKTARSFPAKYEGKCQVCGFAIRVGDAMTWTRRGPNATRTVNQADISSSTEIETMPESIARTPSNSLINLDALAEEMFTRLDGRITAAIEENAPQKIQVVLTEVVQADGTTIDVGMQHKKFATLLRACSRRVNVWLAGPSGSGKTTAAMAVAKSLNLPFYFLGAMEDPFAILGYMDASGKLVRTPAREAYENGGVLLLDECDSYSPSATVALNAMLGNGMCAFPDGVIKRHPDCIIVAGANTWGHGATHEYVGRNKLDTAFLKRFAQIAWGYDSDLELATAPNLAWTKRVQAVRAAVVAKGLRVMVTPRESYIGAELLAAGIPQAEVEEMTIKSGMTEDQWSAVCALAAA